MAEMIAADLFNRQDGNDIDPILGCVTTGDLWRFLKFQAGDRPRLWIDTTQYVTTQVDQILGILTSTLARTLD
ncbi:MAG: hypothetical protein AB4042_21980 [Leptolyngbyaceae cyanobacterium]